MLSIFIIGAEVVVTGAAAFLSMVTLGLAGEVTRSKELTLFGWALGVTYLVVAFTPLISAIWLAYRRFISEKTFPSLEVISSPYLVPVILLIGAAIFCAGLLAFQNGAGLANVK